jgi:hypothetical protein
MRKAALAAVVGAALMLGGCTATAPAPNPTGAQGPSPVPTKTTALNALLPVYPSVLTATTAKSTTVSIADSIQALVAKQSVVYIDDHSQLVPATSKTGSYYGVLRTISVAKSLDPLAQAEAMEKLLAAAGWIERDTATDKGKFLAAMSSSATGAKAWFLLLGGDSTNAKSPVVTVQVASPDLPKK